MSSTTNVPNNVGTQAIDAWSAYYNIPSWIPLSISNVETGGTYSPTAAGDKVNGQPTSFGLFQLHVPNGQGAGYTPSQLYDPNLNAMVGIQHMVPAYQTATKKGLTGYNLLQYVAANSGHPSDTGVLPSSYNTKLQQAYAEVTGQKAPTTSTSPSTSSTSSSSSGSSGLLSGLSGTLTKGFWGLIGFGLVAMGLYIAFNPVGGIATALKRFEKGEKA